MRATGLRRGCPSGSHTRSISGLLNHPKNVQYDWLRRIISLRGFAAKPDLNATVESNIPVPVDQWKFATSADGDDSITVEVNGKRVEIVLPGDFSVSSAPAKKGGAPTKRAKKPHTRFCAA